MSNQKNTFSQLVKNVYQADANQETLDEIRKEFPADVVIDMSNDDNFKAARKTRTRRNKMVEAIKDRRIAFTGEVKDYADDLTEQVNEAFEPVVKLFEIEDAARKEAKAKAEAERKLLLDGQREEIAGLKQFLDSARGTSSENIAGILESIDLIETDCFDKELIHEAIETKKSVIEELHQLLRDTKSREATERERAALAAQAEEQAKKAGIQDRITKLQNIPMSMFGKSAAEVEAKIESIKAVAISEDDFFERAAEAEQAKALVIQQLEMMQQQAQAVEAANEQNRLAEEKRIQEQQAEQSKAMAELEQETKIEQKAEPEEAKTFEQAKESLANRFGNEPEQAVQGAKLHGYDNKEPELSVAEEIAAYLASTTPISDAHAVIVANAIVGGGVPHVTVN